MILGMAAPVFAASPFPDTTGHEDETAIALLKTLALVKGDDLGNFNPDDTITRAEFCAMIVRALGLETASGFAKFPTRFPDVTANYSWAYGYINVATDRGVIKGYPDGTFKPGDPVQQSEALTMVMRALGYKDTLPGSWPMNYIYVGAELGLVESTFQTTASATRAFVARMIGKMLGLPLVYEPNKDNPGEFQDVPGENQPFGYAKLGVEIWKTGMVTAVSTTNKTITLDNGTPKGYASTVVVFGKVDTVSALKGYTVEAWVNKSGAIVFVATTTADYLNGKITAINVSDQTLTVAGVTYEATSDLVATKNNEELPGNVANKLVALLNTTANIWLNEDGEVYRIEARYLDKSGTISKKTVTVDASGTVQKLTFTGSYVGELKLASGVTITKNNAAAAWADLKEGDSCLFAVESDAESDNIVWIDAWRNELKAVQVIARLESGNTKQVVVLINGVSTTYACTSDGWTDVSAYPVGDYWDLILDRDNKVSKATHVDGAVSKITSTIKAVSVEVTAKSGGGYETLYKLTLEDGSSIAIPLVDGYKIHKDSVELTAGAPATLPTFFTSNFLVDDGIYAEKMADATVANVKLYSPTLKGTGEWVPAAGLIPAHFVVVIATDPDPVKTEPITLASGATVTYNGVSALLEELGGKSVKLTWNVSDGKATKVEGYEFCNTVATAVSGISSNDDGSYEFDVVTGPDIVASKDAIVYRNGVKAALSDIQLGDKVMYSSDGNYIEATADTTAPKLDGAVTATWNNTTKKYTLTIKFNEEVQPPTVWIAGTEVKFTTANGGPKNWTYVSAEYDANPGTVSIALTAKDYAGNTLNTTPGVITITEP